MEKTKLTFQQAFKEVSAHSAGGSPFLIAYGATFLITGVMSFFLEDTTVALVAMFQGAVALPVAFWLERQMGWGRMAQDNPLRPLSVTLAMSQALALPALIVAFNLNPRSIPVILAGLAGMHFLPYMWLHRTRLYAIMATALAIGAFILQILFGSNAFNIILLYIGFVYWVAVPALYRHAREVSAS